MPSLRLPRVHHRSQAISTADAGTMAVCPRRGAGSRSATGPPPPPDLTVVVVVIVVVRSSQVPPLVRPSKVGRIGDAAAYSAATQRGVATHAPQHCSREATEPTASDTTAEAVTREEAAEEAEAEAEGARAMAESWANEHAPRGAAATGRGGNGVGLLGSGSVPTEGAAVAAVRVAEAEEEEEEEGRAEVEGRAEIASSSPAQCDSFARESQMVSYQAVKLPARAARSDGWADARSCSSA